MHAQSPSYDLVDGQRVPTDVLSLVVGLQQRTWGMPPEELVPVNVLAILPDTGGSVIVAYDLERGFNADGWLGFAIGFGARSGVFVSHMVGVHEELRGAADVGWYLKIVQAHAALRTGHHAMIWTFDPMRGANARLNIEKIGATVADLTIDKYGVLRSVLYGDVPSDRFTARWDLLSPRTAARIRDVHAKNYSGPIPASVDHLPELTIESCPRLAHERPPLLRYRIPGDVDSLMRADPRRAVRWRQEMRELLPPFLTTKRALVDSEATGAPHNVQASAQPGDYVITGFASGIGEAGERESYYILERNEK